MVIHFNLNILCLNLSVKGLCFYFFLTTAPLLVNIYKNLVKFGQ